MGIPGESRAFDIAERTGLDSSIVDEARKLLAGGDADVSALIANLREKDARLEDARTSCRRNEARLSELSRSLDEREIKVRKQEKELREQGIVRLSRFDNNARKTLENLVRSLREAGKEVPHEEAVEVKQFLENVDEELDEEKKINDALAVQLTQRLQKEEEKPCVPCANIYPGLSVLAGSSRRPGLVVRKGKNNTWIVAVGSISMPFAAGDLYEVPKASSSTVLPVRK
jgi:DNA mismatch repair protein MutS2